MGCVVWGVGCGVLYPNGRCFLQKLATSSCCEFCNFTHTDHGQTRLASREARLGHVRTMSGEKVLLRWAAHRDQMALIIVGCSSMRLAIGRTLHHVLYRGSVSNSTSRMPSVSLLHAFSKTDDVNCE